MEELKKWFTNLNVKLLWKKEFVYTIAGITGYVLFFHLINEAIENFLVINGLGFNWVSNVGLILLCLMILGFSFHKIKVDYKPISWLIPSILVFSFIHLTLRYFKEGEWDYYYISHLHRVAYLDIIVAVTLIFPLLFFIKKWCLGSKEIPENEIHYLEDNPWNENDNQQDEDLFGFTKIAEQLAKPILFQKFNSAFVIGLVGPWGNGKSSLMNMVQNRVQNYKQEERTTKPQEVVTIKFFPYKSDSPASMIGDLLTLFSENLREFDGDLNGELKGYAALLVETVKSKDLTNLFGLLDGSSKSIQSSFDEIDSAIGNLGKKIVVYVDDLDRLDTDEILGVLKLIRATANFKNTVFIVAMDKDYVINKLVDKKEGNNYRFIDKFFQLEIYIPENQKILITAQFLSFINETIETQGDKKISEIELAVKNDKCLFNLFVFNIRDAKRLVNQLAFELSIIDSDVSMVDLINLVLLKVRFPKVFQILLESPRLLLHEDMNKYYLGRSEKGSDQSVPQFFQRKLKDYSFVWENFELSKGLKKDELLIKDRLGLSDFELLELANLLHALFGETKEMPYDSIQIKKNFHQVMRLKYDELDLTPIEFEELVALEGALLKNKIESLIKEGKGPQILAKIPAQDFAEKYIKKERFLKLFVLLANILVVGNKLDNNWVVAKSIDKIGKFFYPVITEKLEMTDEEVNQSVISLILDNTDLHLHQRAYLLSEVGPNALEKVFWPLSPELIKVQSEKIMTEAVNELTTKSVNPYFMTVFGHLNKLGVATLKSTFKNGLLEDFKAQKVIDFISRSLKVFNYEGNRYVLNPTITDVFGSFRDYHSFILENTVDEDSTAFNEYRRFLQLMNWTNFEIPIKFEFNVLTLHIKSNQSGNFDSYKRDSDKTLQMFFSISSKEIFDEIVKHTASRDSVDPDFRYFEVVGSKILMVNKILDDKLVFVQNVLKIMSMVFSDSKFEIVDILNEKGYSVKEADKIILNLETVTPNVFINE